jgi:Undecaprenyl-phosphate galactose phosphotransferase WbaP
VSHDVGFSDDAELRSRILRGPGASAIPIAVGRFTGVARAALLLLSDATALVATGLAAVVVWGVWVRGQSLDTYAPLLVLVPLFPLSYATGGLYPGVGVSAVHLARVLTRQTSLIFLVILASVYVLRLPGSYSRAALAIWWALALVAVPMARAAVAWCVASRPWWREPVVLVGDDQVLDTVVPALDRARHIGYRPIAVTRVGASDDEVSAWHGLPVIGRARLLDTANRLRVHTVLVSARLPGQDRLIAELGARFRRVILIHSLEDQFVEPLAIRYLGNAVGIEIQNRLLMRRNRFIKRLVDIVCGSAGLLVSLPVMLAAAIAIRMSDRGSWRHTQVREGRHGRPFRILKLRTMYIDAEERLQAHLAADPAARAEWTHQFKLANDPRVLPRVGAFLRRWSLDECPQFWNVLRGEMSLVGPRALPLYHLEAFDVDARQLRQRVRPGMTGLWQVMSRGEGGIAAQQALDSYYIYNWSIWLDIVILWRTLFAVLSGRGAR